MNISAQSLVSGEYKFRIVKHDGTVQETGWMKNLILNSGLEHLGQLAESPVYYAFVGTGTTTPAVTQTQLTSLLASRYGSGLALESVNIGAPTYEQQHTYSYSFPQGSVIGNIAEVGIGPYEDGSSLFSRALILDSNGSPTVLSIVELDQLTVFYRLKIKPPLTDRTGSFVVAGVTYNYTARVAYVENFDGSSGVLAAGQKFSDGFDAYACGDLSTLGTIAEAATDMLGNGYSVEFTALPYSPGTRQRVSTARWSYNVANNPNGNGIKGFNVSFGYEGKMTFQYVLDKPIPKTETTELKLNFTFSWARG
jgi:hypothetical protein